MSTFRYPSQWNASRYSVYSATPDGLVDEFIACTAHNKNERTPEALKNTVLIAAAPELLKELRHLVNLIERMRVVVPLSILNGAREAIAKAEGK